MQNRMMIPEDWIECKFVDITSNMKREPFGGDLKKSFFVPSGYKYMNNKIQ